MVLALASFEPDAPPVHVTVFGSSWKDRLDADLPERVTRIDRRVPVRWLNFGWHRLGWPSIERLTGARFDVVHSPHPLLIPSRAAPVVTIHDLDFLDHPERAHGEEVRRDYAALAGRHARGAAQVVVPSRHTALEVVARLGVTPDAVTVCPDPGPGWPPRARQPEPGHFLFVGAVSARKNVGVLIDAYAELRRRHPDAPPLIIAGPTDPESAPWQARAAQPPLRGHVRFTGYIDRAPLRALFEEARALVLPSLHEGFGMPALEAMTLGVPVIASNRGALPEVVDEAGLIVAPETGPLADALERMTEDDALVAACTAKGLTRAAAFTPVSAARALYQAYEKAVHAHRH